MSNHNRDGSEEQSRTNTDEFLNGLSLYLRFYST